MLFSKYNFIYKKEGGIFLYNALSNAMMEISNDLYQVLMRKDVSEKDFENEDSKLVKILNDAKILVEDDEMEFFKLKRMVLERRYSPLYASFTILPTLNCNFACPYCFETKKDISLSNQSIKSIAKFINKLTKNIDSYHITWFGGEPLMAATKMKKLFDTIDKENKKINSSIITNGFLLNDKNISILREMNVSEIQITLDGTEETHNKRKKLARTSQINVFKNTIENINKVSDAGFAIVTLRINVDKNNKDEFIPLKEMLTKQIANYGKRVFIAPAFIEETESNKCDNEVICHLSNKQKNDFMMQLVNEHQYLHPSIYPGNMLYECPVRCNNSWVISPDAGLYKCWEVVGDEKYKVGYLDEEGIPFITNEKVLMWYLEGADPIVDAQCSECSFYPACGGGCIHKRLLNKYSGTSYNTCIYAKNNTESFIKIYSDYAKENC